MLHHPRPPTDLLPWLSFFRFGHRLTGCLVLFFSLLLYIYIAVAFFFYFRFYWRRRGDTLAEPDLRIGFFDEWPLHEREIGISFAHGFGLKL